MAMLEPQRGAFMSFLDWVSRPGQVVKNVIRGNWEGAARQAGDFLLDPTDAFLPGDLIPELSRPEDDVDGASMLGIDREKNPILGTIAGLGVDIALDPLTYLTGGASIAAKTAGKASLKVGVPFTKMATEIPGSAKALSAIGGGVKKAVAAVPGLPEGLSKVGHQIRRGAGALSPGPEASAAIAKGVAKGTSTTQAAQGYALETLRGVPEDIQRKAQFLLEDVIGSPGTVEPLNVRHGMVGIGTQQDQLALIDRRLAKVPWDQWTKDQVRDTAIKTSDYFRTLWKQGVDDSVLTQPSMYRAADGSIHEASHVKGLYADDVARIPGNAAENLDDWAATKGYSFGKLPSDLAPLDYVPRQWEIDEASKLIPEMGDHHASMASLIKPRSITDPRAFADKLNEPGVILKDSLAVTAGQYGAKMGAATQSATIAKAILGDKFKALSDSESRSAITGAIDALRQSGKADTAEALEVAMKGLPPREGVFKLFAGANRLFKQFATGGAFIPKPGFTTRNVVSGVASVASNSESRGVALAQLARAPKDIVGAFMDGARALGMKIGENEFAPLQAAIKASGGDRAKMLANIQDPTMRLAVEHGVMGHGFVTAEQMAADLTKVGTLKDWRHWRDWPQTIVKGAEDRMRYGLFKNLLKEKSPDEAARVATASLFDYAYSSTLNRAIRDTVPFAQYMFKAIPQQAKMLAENPAVAVGLGSLMNGQSDSPTYPHMDGRLTMPIGKDLNGDPQYISGFGLPFESLSSIPNLSGGIRESGREIERTVVGAMSPIIKSAYSAVSGRDPYFESDYGSYSKLPGNIEGGAFGRAYNMVAGTGLIQPLASVTQSLGKMADERRGAGLKTLNMLTGANVVSVNEDRAIQQRLQNALKRNPEVGWYQVPFALEPGTEGARLVEELKDVKKRIKAKRELEKVQPL